MKMYFFIILFFLELTHLTLFAQNTVTFRPASFDLSVDACTDSRFEEVLKITNDGNDPLEISYALDSSGPFRVVSGSRTINPQSSINILIEFSSGSQGIYTLTP